MLEIAHTLLMFVYLILPPAMLLGILFVPRRRLLRVWPNVTVAVATSLILGISASIIYDLCLGGIVSPAQMLITCYCAAGLIAMLKVLDAGLDRAARLIFRLMSSWTVVERRSGAQAVRVILLFVIGLPYMLAAAVTFRPKIMTGNADPWLELGGNSVSFEATDGFRIAGFWTPAAEMPDAPNPHWGRQTLIICPGERGGKTAYYNLASEFVEQGYNVLSFDFRGHGQSEGQIDSFGDRERRDVLGAVRWLRENHAAGARRIVAVGVDTGAAALLAAAADPSREGRAIDALAVYGCYDRFVNLAGVSFPPPLRWLMIPVGVPLACLETGMDLWDFSPAVDAANVAPRPILFIHGLHDPVIPFALGENLYEAASAPKSHIWLELLTDEQAMDDRGIARRARHFLDTAIPML